MDETGETSLARTLSPLEVLLLTLSALSPVLSVFVGGNGVLHLAGTGAALAFLLGGAFNILFTLLYSEIAAAFPGAGGVYPALTRLLGARWSYAYVIMVVPLTFCSAAFGSLGLGAYLHSLVPSLPIAAAAVGGLLLAGLVAMLAVKRGAAITALFLAIELMALAILTVVAILHLRADALPTLLHPMMMAGGRMAATPPLTLAMAVVAGVWATAGAVWGLYFAEEMRDVQRRIGRVIAWAGAIASLTIAIPMVLVVLAIDDAPAVLASDAPIATFLGRSAGLTVQLLVSIGVVAAIFNALIAAVMGNSRFLFAVGRDRALFGPVNRLFAHVHAHRRSPIGATLTLMLGGAALTLLGEQRLLILLSGNVSDYILVAVAVWAGRRSGLTGRFFKVPLHPLVPIIGLSFGLAAIVTDWNDATTGRPSMILLLGVFGAASLFFRWRRRKGDVIVLHGSDQATTPALTD